MDKPTFSFKAFLQKFPKVDLPLTLGEDTHHSFSTLNSPLPQGMIEQYIYPHEEGQVDELTEFVPCFQVKEAGNLIVLVYWKAGLMDYQYVMLTYTDKGRWVDRKVIAGTYSDGNLLTQSIATIDEDLIITIASGQVEDGKELNPEESTVYSLEILPNGSILNQ